MSFSTDWDLKQRLVNFFEQKDLMRRGSIRVDVSDGVVTLSGAVHSYYAKQLLFSAAQRVAGVLSIEDDLTVISEQTWNDQVTCESVASL